MQEWLALKSFVGTLYLCTEAEQGKNSCVFPVLIGRRTFGC